MILLVSALHAAAPEPRMLVTLTPSATRITSLDALVLDVLVTNGGTEPVRLPLWRLEIPSVTLEITDIHNRPVPKGPPPVPPRDDGEQGRVTLAPGESLPLRFTGGTLLGTSPEPGRYRVRYHVTLQNWGPAHDWEGELSSPWVDLRLAD